MPRDINLIGGFYESKSLPFSAQDTVNWLPVPSQVEGSRSPIKLRGLPGLNQIQPPILVDDLVLSGDAPNYQQNASGYSYTYTTTGGTGPYTYAIISGALPAGLSINASTSEITGTPTVVETASFTVEVTDANGLTDTLDDQIDITASAVEVEILSTGFDTSAGTQTLNVPIPASTAEGDYLLFYCHDVTSNTAQGLSVPSGQSIGGTTSLSATGSSGSGPKITSGPGQGMLARAEDVSNGYVPCTYSITASSGQNTVITCIKIPASITISGISSSSDESVRTGINTKDPPSRSAPAPAPDDFLVFAFYRVTGGSSVTGMPYSVYQETETGPGTTGNNGTAQTVAACYGGILNGSAFDPTTFTSADSASSQFTRTVATLILRKA